MEHTHYLAHRSEDGREQTVLEHLAGTAEHCARFAAFFGAEEQGRLAGLAHNLGKYSAQFQRRLQGSPERVDHSTAGAAECCKPGQNCAAFAVAGHHGGLPDGGGQVDHDDSPTFFGRMRRAGPGKLPLYGDWQKGPQLPRAPLPALSNSLDAVLYTRMLYSCLVDADFLDTEAFMAGTAPERGGGASMEQLEQRLLAHVSGWFPPKTVLNQERCLEQGESRRPGLPTLTIPTGGRQDGGLPGLCPSPCQSHGLRPCIFYHFPTGQALRHLRRTVYRHPARIGRNLPGVPAQSARCGTVPARGISSGAVPPRHIPAEREAVLGGGGPAYERAKQVLCIVNSRKSTQTVYSFLEHDGAFHLSTLMYPAHRKAALEKIRTRLKADLPCRVVSTSLIEARVDVDFPTVFREEAGLDSILQAAGRCSREGTRPAEESVVTIFQGGDRSAPPV